MKRTLNQTLTQSLKTSPAFCAALLLTIAAFGCSKKGGDGDSSDDDTSGITGTGGQGAGNTLAVGADVPPDSTGASAPVTLVFATSSSAALALAGGLDVGGGLELTEARVSIGKIKIKASKERSAEERALRDELKAQRKAREKEIEAEKDALEAEKEAIEKSYEPRFEGLDGDEKDALKDQMEAEKDAVEAKLSLLEEGKDAELEAFESERDGNLRWKGPFVYDLVAGGVTPAIPAVDLADGSYRRIEFKVRPNHEVDAADPLLNHSIYAAGTVDVGGTATPFTVSLRAEEEFMLMGAGAFVVEPSVEAALTVAFAPANWFTDVDFTAATLDASGTIAIDDATNVDIYKAIVKNLKSSTRFGKDEDHDGKLGESEHEGDGDEGIAVHEQEDEQESEVD
jgi:hypothetical protein